MQTEKMLECISEASDSDADVYNRGCDASDPPEDVRSTLEAIRVLREKGDRELFEMLAELPQ